MTRPIAKKSKLSHWLARCCAALVLVCYCPAALAASPAPEERERARALMDQGDARFEAGSYDAALQAYQAADQIMQVPTTASEVGRALEKLGRLLQAREVLRRVAASAVRADEPKAFALARQRAARQVSEITPRLARVLIRITGAPAASEPELSVDGQALPGHQAGVAIELDPGAHRLTAHLPGFVDASSEFSLSEGQLREVVLAFDAAVARAQPATSAVVAPADSSSERSESGARRKPALLWTGVGVAAVGLGVGAVTGLKSLSLTNEVKDRCKANRCPASANDDIASAKVLANVSNVAFAVGVVGLAVGVWQLLTPRASSAPAAAHAAPHIEVAIGPRAVNVQGAF